MRLVCKISISRMMLRALVLVTLVITGATVQGQSCDYNKVVYEDGEDIYTSPDGCLTTTCVNGEVILYDICGFFISSTTTKRTTITPTSYHQCYQNGYYYPIGASVPSLIGSRCETCTCTDTGIECTQKQCSWYICKNRKRRRNWAWCCWCP